ncbi:MAG: hypothetical protein Q9184_006297 [Pyrenodesmia sp. 2 TL-2023]
MAGHPTKTSFEKALGAIELLADVYTSLKDGEGTEVYKLVNRELNAMLEAASDLMDPNRSLDYLLRMAALRTRLDARKVAYNVPGMNNMAMNLLSTVKIAFERATKAEVSPALDVPPIKPGTKRAASAMEDPNAIAINRDISSAKEIPLDKAVKKQRLVPLVLNKCWKVSIESYRTGGRLYKPGLFQNLTFEWDNGEEDPYVHKPDRRCFRLPEGASGMVAIAFSFLTSTRQEYYVRLIPIVSQLVTYSGHGILDLKLANRDAAQAIAGHLQKMDNVVFHVADP